MYGLKALFRISLPQTGVFRESDDNDAQCSWRRSDTDRADLRLDLLNGLPDFTALLLCSCHHFIMSGTKQGKSKMTSDTTTKRHPDFYFPDGSVVLIVENTALRIHQSVLARHSEVFSGMFDVPQPSDVDTYDACPTVVLQDSLDDVVDVMRVIYNALCV